MAMVEQVGCSCSECGAPLAVPRGRTPKITFVGSSGKPNARVVVVDRKEIHRCESHLPG